MPSKTKQRNAEIAARSAALPKIPEEVLDQVFGPIGPMTGEQINAATTALKKALIERADQLVAAALLGRIHQAGVVAGNHGREHSGHTAEAPFSDGGTRRGMVEGSLCAVESGLKARIDLAEIVQPTGRVAPVGWPELRRAVAGEGGDAAAMIDQKFPLREIPVGHRVRISRHGGSTCCSLRSWKDGQRRPRCYPGD